jgi:integrase/recombinase XerD
MKLSELADEYLSYKHALGTSFITEACIIKAFIRYVGNVPLASVTTNQIQRYLEGNSPVSSFWARKHTALGGLYRFALSHGYVAVIPFPYRRPKLPSPLVPYIYSRAELKRLLASTPAACGFRVPMEAYVFHTLILVLYGACLRIGEALRLTLSETDLDQSVLCIKEAKFYKTRLVPIGKDLDEQLCHYVQQRNITHGREGSAPLFCFRDGRPLSQSAVRAAFRRLLVHASVHRNDAGRYQPRLHDLRHTGVVHRLIAWYRCSADVHYLLPQLATYLGHTDLSSTQHYLTLTTELLNEASQRFECYTRE